MIYLICSVFDAKANAFGVPFFTQNNGTARRSFAALSNDPQSMVSKAPEDFALYSLGEFDDTSAAISTHAQPQFLANTLSQKG